jgi:hypothetical protein
MGITGKQGSKAAAGRRGRSGDPRAKIAGSRRGKGKAPSRLDRLRMRMRRRPSPPPSRMSRILDSLTGHRRAA